VVKNLIIKSYILTPFFQYGLNDEQYRLPGIPTIRWMGMTNTGVPYMNFMLSKYFTYQNVNVNKHKKIIQQRNTSNY